MENIILVGLTRDQNLGDPLIFECTRTLLKKSFMEHKKQYEFRELDLYGRSLEMHCPVYRKAFLRLRLKIAGDSWEKGALLRVREDIQQKVDKFTKAIIFCGGGLIKYNHQFLAESVVAVIRYAEKMNIPIMMSAVGVEGYDANNNECIALKQAINLPCVKYITTRDDIELLNATWAEPGIKTELVFDPACYASQMIAPAEKQANVIGLGICRGGLFEDYGIHVSSESLSTLWKNLYKRLTYLGFECKFFTNGFLGDQEFAERIVDEMHLDRNSVLIRRPTTTEELCRTISSMRSIIATRLHSSIIAYSYNVPFVGLVWNQKQKQFGRCIGREWSFVESASFTADNIIECLQKAMEMEAVTLVPAESSNTFHWLEQFLEEFVYCS